MSVNEARADQGLCRWMSPFPILSEFLLLASNIPVYWLSCLVCVAGLKTNFSTGTALCFNHQSGYCVIGKSWSRSAETNSVVLASSSNKHKRDIPQDKRSMAKLWKESVVRDCLCGLEGKYTQPIYDALAKAGLSLNDITSVIEEARLLIIVPGDKFSLNVNADEAAVLGAGLHGASLSRQFKTKNIKATLMLSESGFVSVTDAMAFGEMKDESIPGKLKGLFVAGSSSLSCAETETESAAEASSASEAAPSASAPSEAKAEKVDLKDLTTIPLNLTVHFTSIPHMTVEESVVEDLLDPENRDTPFKEYSQDSERAPIEEKLEESDKGGGFTD
ncbi:hypothetical protein ARMSODRAFT_982335 [Armillaria solidipes]|uniref:Uncharacterized protein n=1 Tax=Armillaria solidipes TaxID=1076256 RepID=A0A2H3ANJ7_9AGAR|nr:hypothetical protein ARMSODRAFT_982335 [Armillaria solidipes]